MTAALTPVTSDCSVDSRYSVTAVLTLITRWQQLLTFSEAVAGVQFMGLRGDRDTLGVARHEVTTGDGHTGLATALDVQGELHSAVWTKLITRTVLEA